MARYTFKVSLTVSTWSDEVPTVEAARIAVEDAIDNHTEAFQAWSVVVEEPVEDFEA